MRPLRPLRPRHVLRFQVAVHDAPAVQILNAWWIRGQRVGFDILGLTEMIAYIAYINPNDIFDIRISEKKWG